MSQKPFSLLDLIRHDEFITWVRRPTPDSDRKWEGYIAAFPNQKETIEQAKGYINVIAEDTGRDLPTHSQSQKMWQKVKSTIDSENAHN